jgi:hypothetical protein
MGWILMVMLWQKIGLSNGLLSFIMQKMRAAACLGGVEFIINYVTISSVKRVCINLTPLWRSQRPRQIQIG